MAFDTATSNILTRLRRYLTGLEDEHTRQMAAAWARAWDDIAPELAAALDALTESGEPLTRLQIIEARRLTNALDLIERRLAGLFDESADAAIAPLREVVDNAGATTDQMISSQLPPGAVVDGWARVSDRAVDSMVLRATERITKRTYPLSSEATAVMRRELVRGLLTGTNPRESARRMLAATERRFNGGLTRAMTIARTETLDAHRAGDLASRVANADVLEGWTWVSALTARTCPACWAKHGSVHPVDEPGPDDHQCGRCVAVPNPKPWSQLGFDIPEPDSLIPDAGAAFDQLSPGEQRDILGPARFTAWQAGDFPMSGWATKRTSDGWRDSWVPARAPRAYRFR